MLATANTAVAAIDRLKERRASDIRFVCLVAAPEGIERLRGTHSDVPVWTAAIDDYLDEHGFIVPGLGDAGEDGPFSNVAKPLNTMKKRCILSEMT